MNVIVGNRGGGGDGGSGSNGDGVLVPNIVMLIWMTVVRVILLYRKGTAQTGSNY
jgi:hypothetical protein